MSDLADKLQRAEAECERLRSLAHEAPFAEWSMDHRGHSSIVNHTNSWATRGNEWMAACEKRDAIRAALQEARR
jgi:hypothetical protein